MESYCYLLDAATLFNPPFYQLALHALSLRDEAVSEQE